MSKELNLNNHFIIATPKIDDELFKRSVVYIFKHDETGAEGLILNKPLPIQLQSIFEHLHITSEYNLSDTIVYHGGPMEQENGFILHPGMAFTDDGRQQEVINISSSKSLLKKIAQKQGPERFLLALGYAAWEPNQLEQELAENDWLVAPADTDIIFSPEPERLWLKAGELLGVNLNFFSEQVGHA